MSDHGEACGHSHVRNHHVPNGNGTFHDEWRCDDCQTKFVPKREFDLMRHDYEGVCKTVAEMHAAAIGEFGRGPIRGVVEDVAHVGDILRKLLALLLPHSRSGPGQHEPPEVTRK